MKTGIVFNDEMDDFSSPAFENDWDVQVIFMNFLVVIGLVKVFVIQIQI